MTPTLSVSETSAEESGNSMTENCSTSCIGSPNMNIHTLHRVLQRRFPQGLFKGGIKEPGGGVTGPVSLL